LQADRTSDHSGLAVDRYPRPNGLRGGGSGGRHWCAAEVQRAQKLVIEAREATANGTELSFDDSRWEFSGDVRIRFADGSLAADLATVSFRANRIETAAATGSPARFEQKLASMARPARGTAGRIDYEVAAGRIRLADKAWLSDGRNEINSDALIYNVRAQRVETEAATVGDDRVRITIKPGEPDAARQP
jgi:lipopolysaccharide transport protein LptA